MASQPSKKGPKKAERAREESKKLERIDSLPWNQSLSENADPFSLLIGTNELEGGFLSLEEIDESEYGLEVPKPERENKNETSKQTTKSKKRKRSEGEDGPGDEAEAGKEEKVEEEDKKVKRKKKKKKNKNKKKNEKNTEENEETTAG